MVIGITMIKAVPGQERLIYCTLKGDDGILDVYHIFGEYDFFVILQAEDLRRLNQLLEDIQSMNDVIAARTVLIGWNYCLREIEPVGVQSNLPVANEAMP